MDWLNDNLTTILIILYFLWPVIKKWFFKQKEPTEAPQEAPPPSEAPPQPQRTRQPRPVTTKQERPSPPVAAKPTPPRIPGMLMPAQALLFARLHALKDDALRFENVLRHDAMQEHLLAKLEYEVIERLAGLEREIRHSAGAEAIDPDLVALHIDAIQSAFEKIVREYIELQQSPHELVEKHEAHEEIIKPAPISTTPSIATQITTTLKNSDALREAVILGAALAPRPRTFR